LRRITEQGLEMGRPSRITVGVEGTAEAISMEKGEGRMEKGEGRRENG